MHQTRLPVQCSAASPRPVELDVFVDYRHMKGNCMPPEAADGFLGYKHTSEPAWIWLRSWPASEETRHDRTQPDRHVVPAPSRFGTGRMGDRTRPNLLSGGACLHGSARRAHQKR